VPTRREDIEVEGRGDADPQVVDRIIEEEDVDSSRRSADRRAEHARAGVLTQEVLELRHTDEIDSKASLGESGHHRTLLG